MYKMSNLRPVGKDSSDSAEQEKKRKYSDN